MYKKLVELGVQTCFPHAGVHMICFSQFYSQNNYETGSIFLVVNLCVCECTF